MIINYLSHLGEMAFSHHGFSTEEEDLIITEEWEMNHGAVSAVAKHFSKTNVHMKSGCSFFSQNA